MATIVKTIGSGGGRDFSTLAAWAAALPANLVTDGNSYQGNCYNDSEFTSTSNLLNLTGNTTDATHTITLTTGAGQSFRDNVNAQTNALVYNVSNGVGISITGTAYVDALDIADNNVFLSNLQIKNVARGYCISTTGTTTISNCIVQGTGAGSLAVVSFSAVTTLKNSLFYLTGSTLSNHGVVFLNANASLYFCTVVVASDAANVPNGGIYEFYVNATVENVAIFGAASVFFGHPGTNTNTTCMTDVVSPPVGFTGSKTYGNQFQGTTVAAADFREKSGADLQGAGTADSTNGAIDIVGTARPQGPTNNWDIGAWEIFIPVIIIPASGGDDIGLKVYRVGKSWYGLT